MIRHTITIKLCLLMCFAVFAVQASTAAAAEPRFFWQEEGKSITTNKDFTLETATGSQFRLRTTVLATSGTVTCQKALVKNGVLFGSANKTGNKVGRDEGELQFSMCTTNICTGVSEPIKIPITGSGQSALVSNASEEASVTKVYDDLFPNTNKEFMTLTLTGGLCGTGIGVRVVTSLTRGAFSEAQEGEAGLLAEVDGERTQAEKESVTHELTFFCAGTSQEPKEAFQAEGNKIKVDELQAVFSSETHSACIEGKASFKLESNKTFSVR
jgi:hypothetical protein